MFNLKSLSMKKSVRLMLVACVLCAVTTFSCREPEPKSDPTPQVNFSHSVNGRVLTFHALSNWGTFHWDFGDGKGTSTERNPTYEYAIGGTYDVTLTVTGKNETQTITKEMSVALSNFQMLAGDNRVTEKRWRLSPGHSSTDRVAFANQNFTLVNALGAMTSNNHLNQIGLIVVYQDEFVFQQDGGYRQYPVGGGAFAGRRFVAANGMEILPPGATNSNAIAFNMCYAAFAPAPNATYTFVEDEDYTVLTNTGNVTYRNAMTLDFSAGAYLGFMDFTKKCIILSLTPDRMQVAIFVSQIDGNVNPNWAVLFTLEPVR